MKHSLQHTVLFLCLFVSIVFALDYEMVLFDPLPENAEELAKAHVDDFLSQRYPGETIVIGEVIPLYVNDNDIRILDFILELDGSEPCTLEKELTIHTSFWENYDKFEVYMDSLSGDIEALRQASLGNDLIYIELQGQVHDFWLLQNSISHILIAFVSGEPRIIGTHSTNRLLSTYKNLSESQMLNFLGFGFLPSGCPDVFIAVIVKDELGNVEWIWNNEFTIFEDAHPICNIEPMKWSFFSIGFKDRGKEDLPPEIDLGYKYDIYTPLPEIDMFGDGDCFPTCLCMRYIHLDSLVGYIWQDDFFFEVMAFYDEYDNKSEWYAERFMVFVNDVADDYGYDFEFPHDYMPYDYLDDFEDFFKVETIWSAPSTYKVNCVVSFVECVMDVDNSNISTRFNDAP